MFDSPRRSPLSIARAKVVFQRFARSSKQVGRTESQAIVAFGVALMCGLISLLIAILRWAPGLLPLPALAAEQTIAMAILIVFLSGLGGLLASRRGTSWRRRLGAAPWPLLGPMLLPPHTSSEQAAALEAPLPALPAVRLEGGGKTFRAPYAARLVGLGFLPLMIQIFGTGIALLFLAASLARMPAGSDASRLADGIQIYVGVAGVWACYRCETNNRRGSLALRRRIPWWPFAWLPGIGVLAAMALAERMTPGSSRRTGATDLFFNRKTVRRESWTAKLNLLPRMRGSELAMVGDSTRAQSILRCRAALLMLQMTACGILWPLELGSLFFEFLLSLGATTALIAGVMIKNMKPPEQSSLQRSSRVAWGWLAVSLGSATLGLLIGSNLGLALPLVAAGHLALLGIWGSSLGALLVPLTTAWSNTPFRELIWVPVLMTALTAGLAGTMSPPIARGLGEALALGSILAWLAELPLSLRYQRLFLEPFSLRDLGRRDLPAAARQRLLPLAAALLAPLGGLTNAVLAVASLRRDRLFRLWWETIGARA